MEVTVLKILESVLEKNDETALRNQTRLDKHGILTINVMSSPGAGKTSLILNTINGLKQKARIAVIEGDVASTVDADKVHGSLVTIKITPASDVSPDKLIEKANNILGSFTFKYTIEID